MYGVFTTPISHERPPRLNDHFLAYKGVVVQARDYCSFNVNFIEAMITDVFSLAA